MDNEIVASRIEDFCKSNKGSFKKDETFSVCKVGKIEITMRNKSGFISVDPVDFAMTGANEIGSVWKDKDMRDIQINSHNAICRIGSQRGQGGVLATCIEQPDWD